MLQLQAKTVEGKLVAKREQHSLDDSGHIQHPACDPFLAAMRKISQLSILILRTRSALFDNDDLRVLDPCLQELLPVGLPKVERHPTSVMA